MARKFDQFNKRRLKSSYFGVVMSISMVLFVLGFLAVLLYNADNISRSVKENFSLTVLIQPEANEMKVRQYQKMVAGLEGVRKTEFISKEEAAEVLKKELDEDFLQYLGTNPLTDAIDIWLEAEYLEMGYLENLKVRIADDMVVQEILIDEDLAEMVYSNLRRISIFLLSAALVLSLISFFLINNSIQLAIYSRRFIIKTMQLVGATRGFIRRPFLLTGSIHGLIGGIVASIFLALALLYLNTWIPDLNLQNQIKVLSIIPLILIILGVLISRFCTYFAVRKYLNLKTDQLYY
ncbi:MAG: ABC transporter permease [Cryomorphaceae bacterium]|nr:ABC transporter permease [Cryomorphaceae bacterium]